MLLIPEFGGEEMRVGNRAGVVGSKRLAIGIAAIHATKGVAQSEELAPPRLTIADWFSPEYHHIENTRGNEVVVRGYFPWQLDGIDMLARISTPYTTSSPGHLVPGNSLINDFPSGPTGFGDMEI